MSKLLLVEDDNNLREIYEARLQAEGYTIVTARDGEEALVVAKAERPDLIISDIMMPKISGFEMLDILRNTENLKSVPVIMLTALGQNDDQQRADKLGADRYLVKSQVTLEDIVKVTHELLGDSPAPAEAAPEASVPTTTSAAEPVVPAPPAAAPPAPTIPTLAPAAAPEPVAPAPTTAAPEAAPAPASSVPDPTPPTTPAPTSTPASTDGATATAAATTTAQEGAAVEARIEDFVAGASQDAAPPPPAKDDSTTPAPEDAKPADSPIADQELVEQAVQNIEANAQSDTTAAPAEPAPPAETAEAAPEAADAAPATPATTSAVVHDKVIKPLEADPKKDINTLLALEAVKEAKSGLSEPATPVIVDDAKSPVQPPPTANDQATAVGANPTPSSVITPVSSGDDAAPVISSSSSASTPPSTTEEPAADLNNIAL
jgi:CheY-like chemotaxis protein